MAGTDIHYEELESHSFLCTLIAVGTKIAKKIYSGIYFENTRMKFVETGQAPGKARVDLFC